MQVFHEDAGILCVFQGRKARRGEKDRRKTKSCLMERRPKAAFLRNIFPFKAEKKGACWALLLSVKKQKVTKEFFTRLKEKILAFAKSSVRRLNLRGTNGRAAIFSFRRQIVLLQPSYTGVAPYCAL